MIKEILLSLTKTVIVAIGLGYATWYITGHDLLKCCLAYLIGQYILFYFWNSVLEQKQIKLLAQEETERIKIYNQHGVEANCAHCNHPNYIPIRMDEENQFICEQCGKPNAVYVDVTVAQKTEILDRERVSVNSYIKNKLDAEEKTS